MTAVAQPRARILNVTLDQYFADPCPVPSLSQSIAHVLLTRSPAHAWVGHPRLGKPVDDAEESTEALDKGALIHAMLLGKGSDFELIRYDDYRKKAAQELRDAARSAGRVPILEYQYQELAAAAESLRRTIAGYGIEFAGQSEVPIEWHERGHHGDVVCRGLLDHLIAERGVIYDIKKIRSADARTCSRHAIEYGYDIQHAAYTSAVTKLLPELAGRIDFVFVFIEIEPPYAVVPCRPDGALRELGERRWERATSLWEHCLRENRWPPYTANITTLEAPPWAIAQEELAAANW